MGQRDKKTCRIRFGGHVQRVFPRRGWDSNPRVQSTLD